MDSEETKEPSTGLPSTHHYTHTLRREPWRVLHSAQHRLGPRIIQVDEIESPDASRRLTWTFMKGRHAVIILALDDDGNALLVREYRHPLGREIFNLPAGGAGHSDDEEELREHAARELAEETCFQAREWTRLGSYYPLPGATSATFHVFLARGLEPLTEIGTGDEWCEIEEVARVPFTELYRSALAGEVEDGITLTVILWAAAKGIAPA
ncbi:MAG: NUDIX hydrolase [Armatimonadetes bacterium]|nr:NUDIX hydrolase [Armatimonadota bacterium]